MQALVEVEYEGGLHGDHWPEMVGGLNVGTAYTVSYIKALVNCARSDK